MKFGKYLATRQLELPEYAEEFINYKQLKKLINRLAGKDPKAQHENLQAHKSSFFFQLERELEKVQTCYQQKEQSLEARLTTLSTKLTAVRDQGIGHNSSDYVGLHESFLRFRSDLERLEEFVELNGTGFVKVLKKWDKRSHLHTKELFLRRAVEIQPMFNREILGEISDTANKLHLELEAANTGETVFEPNRVSQPSNDLLNEFITHCQSTGGDLNEWRAQLLALEPPRLSAAFRALVASTASDDVVLQFYDNQVDLVETDEYSGKSVLHYSAGASRGPKVIELCLKHVAVDLKDQYGRTALHYATISKQELIVKALLDAGASPNVLDHDNYSPLHYALFFNLKEIFALLLNSGARVDGNSERDYIALNLACQFNAEDCLGVYLAKYPKPQMVADAEGLFPLHIVARTGHWRLVAPLVAAGAELSQLDKLNEWTPLIFAAAAGTYETVQALLEAGADWTILDERGYSALFYACWQGHSRSVMLLRKCLPAGTNDISRASIIKSAQEEEDDDDFDLDALDLDEVPALSLPPPIIPIQRYGHSFLDSQKVILQITLGKNAIEFQEDRRLLSAGRLTISTSSTTRNIELPVREDQKVQLFQVDNLDKFCIDFEVLPTYGTRVMVKATALSALFQQSSNITLPLLNALLRASGTLRFSYLVVLPYPGTPLEVTKFDTYWKSTSYVESSTVAYPRDHYHANHTVDSASASYSLVNGTSLKGQYRRVPVTMSSDGVVMVSESTNLLSGVQIAVSSLRAGDVAKLFPSIQTLEEYLASGEAPAKVNIYVSYPTTDELDNSDSPVKSALGLNETADGILKVVFAHVRSGAATKFLFTSPNSHICTVINWKQANFPVLFVLKGLLENGHYASANNYITAPRGDGFNPVNFSCKEAARFAAQNNLMGVVLPGWVLKLTPAVAHAVRVLGLVVIADGMPIEGVDGVSVEKFMNFTAAE